MQGEREGGAGTFFKKKKCMAVLPVFVHLCLGRPIEGIGPPGTGVVDGCEAPWGSWRLNPGPLQELSS